MTIRFIDLKPKEILNPNQFIKIEKELWANLIKSKQVASNIQQRVDGDIVNVELTHLLSNDICRISPQVKLLIENQASLRFIKEEGLERFISQGTD